MKTFNIFKSKSKKSEKAPGYTISFFDKQSNKSVTIGGCWVKDSKDGGKYFSCKLDDGYKDRQGFSVVSDTVPTGQVEVATIDIDAEDIPF